MFILDFWRKFFLKNYEIELRLLQGLSIKALINRMSTPNKVVK